MNRSLLIIAALALLAAACGGGDKGAERGASAQPTDRAGEELVSVGAVLSESARRTGEIETMSGEFSMEMGMGGGQSFDMSGTMVMDADRMFMEMDMFGESFSVLMILPDFYLRFTGDDWVRMDLATAGIDPEAFKTYMDNNGIVDLDMIAELTEDGEQLPDEVIDGKNYNHYTGTFDYADLIKDPAAKDLLTGPAAELVEDAEGTVVVDYWIDPDTMLPRRVVMDMNVEMPGVGEMDMTMTMDFLEFNGEVDIPEPPADAKDFSEYLEETS